MKLCLIDVKFYYSRSRNVFHPKNLAPNRKVSQQRNSSPKAFINRETLSQNTYLPSAFSQLQIPLPIRGLSYLPALELSISCSSFLIILASGIIIGHVRVNDFIADFHPYIRSSWYWLEAAEEIVRSSCDDEATEEIETVDIRCANWDRLANRSDKADNIDEDTANVGRVTSPRETERVVVGGCLLGGVEILDPEVAAADEVVIADNNTGNGGEENGIGGEVGGEVVRGGKQIPRTHDKAYQSTDVASAADVDVAWEKGGHVSSRRNAVCCDVGSELSKSEG